MSKIKIAIILRPVIKDEFKAVIINLLRWLARRNISYYFLESEEEKIKNISFPGKIINKKCRCDYSL